MSLSPLKKFQDSVQSREDIVRSLSPLPGLLPEEPVDPHKDWAEEGLARGAALLQPDVGHVGRQNADRFRNYFFCILCGLVASGYGKILG